MAEKNTAADIARELLELAHERGATNAVVMISTDEARSTPLEGREESYFAGFLGAGLAVRGLLELGVERIRAITQARVKC